MKCTTIFLVLSMVVLMAQPGEGFFGWLIKGLGHGISAIHKAVNGNSKDLEDLLEQQQQLAEQQEQLDKRAFEQFQNN
uniref:Dicentracin-like n=2 Tax=Oryzias melastigma TaxID=30732 RepID=A0A3B3CP40_ORYME